jgi:uncharacterized protein YecA (UPF0149 family)
MNKYESEMSVERLRELDQFLRVRDEDMNLVKAHGLITCLASIPEENFDKLEHHQIFFDNLTDNLYNQYIPKIKATVIAILKTTSAKLHDNLADDFDFIFSVTGFCKISNNINTDQLREWCAGYVLGLHIAGLLDTIQDPANDSSVLAACSTIMFFADIVNVKKSLNTVQLEEVDNIKKASMNLLPSFVRKLYDIWSRDLQNTFLNSSKDNILCPCGSNKQYAICCRLEAISEMVH